MNSYARRICISCSSNMLATKVAQQRGQNDIVQS
jgi:hypothetical protein